MQNIVATKNAFLTLSFESDVIWKLIFPASLEQTPTPSIANTGPAAFHYALKLSSSGKVIFDFEVLLKFCQDLWLLKSNSESLSLS